MSRYSWSIVLVATVVLFALSYIWLTVFGASSAFMLGGLQHSDETEIAVKDDLFQQCQSRGVGVTARLVLIDLDETSAEATAELSLCVAKSRISELVDSKNMSVVADSTATPMTIEKRHRAALFTFSIESNYTADKQVRTVRLDDLVEQGDEGVGTSPGWASIGAVNLDLVGDPRSFPLDDYFSEFAIDFQLPPQLVAVNNRERSTAIRWPIDTIEIVESPRLRSLDVSAWRNNADGTLWLAFSRDKTTISFVVLVLLLPLLLGLVLLGLGLRRLRAGQTIEVIVGAAAVLIALLPIRAVLVPRDIETLSLVDYTLGVQLAFLTLVATIVAVSTHAILQREQEEQDAHSLEAGEPAHFSSAKATSTVGYPKFWPRR